MWYILCYVWCWVQVHRLLAPHPQGWNYRHRRTRCILEISNGRTTLLKSNIYPTVTEFDAQGSQKCTCSPSVVQVGG